MERLRRGLERLPVAFHEEGHAVVAGSLGWSVLLRTVIPEGNALGLTKVSPNLAKSKENLILDAIAISVGGEMAEEMCGVEDHSGCGSDRFKQRILAAFYIRLTGSIRTVGEVVSEQQSRARSILSSIGSTMHGERSFSLLRAGVLI